MKVLTQKNIKTTFLVVLLTKLFVLMIDLLSQLLFIEVKMLLMNLLKQFLKSMNIPRKEWTYTLIKIGSWVRKKNIYFNKVTVEDL